MTDIQLDAGFGLNFFVIFCVWEGLFAVLYFALRVFKGNVKFRFAPFLSKPFFFDTLAGFCGGLACMPLLIAQNAIVGGFPLVFQWMMPLALGWFVSSYYSLGSAVGCAVAIAYFWNGQEEFARQVIFWGAATVLLGLVGHLLRSYKVAAKWYVFIPVMLITLLAGPIIYAAYGLDVAFSLIEFSGGAATVLFAFWLAQAVGAAVRGTQNLSNIVRYDHGSFVKPISAKRAMLDFIGEKNLTHGWLITFRQTGGDRLGGDGYEKHYKSLYAAVTTSFARFKPLFLNFVEGMPTVFLPHRGTIADAAKARAAVEANVRRQLLLIAKAVHRTAEVTACVGAYGLASDAADFLADEVTEYAAAPSFGGGGVFHVAPRSADAFLDDLRELRSLGRYPVLERATVAITRSDAYGLYGYAFAFPSESNAAAAKALSSLTVLQRQTLRRIIAMKALRQFVAQKLQGTIVLDYPCAHLLSGEDRRSFANKALSVAKDARSVAVGLRTAEFRTLSSADQERLLAGLGKDFALKVVWLGKGDALLGNLAVA